MAVSVWDVLCFIFHFNTWMSFIIHWCIDATVIIAGTWSTITLTLRLTRDPCPPELSALIPPTPWRRERLFATVSIERFAINHSLVNWWKSRPVDCSVDQGQWCMRTYDNLKCMCTPVIFRYFFMPGHVELSCHKIICYKWSISSRCCYFGSCLAWVPWLVQSWLSLLATLHSFSVNSRTLCIAWNQPPHSINSCACVDSWVQSVICVQ